MKEIKPNEIIINAKGETRQIFPPHIPETPPEQIITFPDKKETHVDWRLNFERVIEVQKILKEANIGQEEATVRPDLEYPDLPMLLAIIADAHLFSVGTDHELLKKHLDLIINQPNVRMLDCGDDVDMGIWGDLVFEQVLPPYMQGFTMRDLARELGDKMIAILGGNHNDWMKACGTEFYDAFLRNAKCPVMPAGGMIHLEIGKQTYDVAAKHTHWGRSRLNATNASKRLIQWGYPDADCAILGHCFSEDTEVLTKNGWKTFDKISVKEEVMTRNLETGTSEWNKVKQIFQYTHYKKLVHFQGRDINLLVTPDHAIVSSWNHNKNSYKRTKAKTRVGKKTYMPAAGVNLQPDTKSVSDDWLKLAAWVITEGSYSKETKSYLRIAQSNKPKVGVEHITNICDRLGVTYKVEKRYSAGKTEHKQHRNYDAYRINLCSQPITKQIVKIFPNKQLNNWLFNLSKRQFDLFFSELILGDGNKNSMGQGYQYSSKHEQEIDILQALCAINGYRTSKIKRKRQNICYVLTINPKDYVMASTGGKEVKYNGKSWCVSVKNKTLFVRRGGKVVISGNTHQAAMEQFYMGGKNRLAVVGGTFKLDDQWSKRKGISDSQERGGLGILFYPNERKMIPFLQMEDGVEYLNTLIELKKYT